MAWQLYAAGVLSGFFFAAALGALSVRRRESARAERDRMLNVAFVAVLAVVGSAIWAASSAGL